VLLLGNLIDNPVLISIEANTVPGDPPAKSDGAGPDGIFLQLGNDLPGLQPDAVGQLVEFALGVRWNLNPPAH